MNSLLCRLIGRFSSARFAGACLVLCSPLLLGGQPAAEAASPEDAVIFDFDNTTIYTINSQGATAGAATVVASPSVGSGTAFTQKVSFGTVSPTQQLYYWNSNTGFFYRVDLTSASYPRAQVITPSNPAFIPWLPQRGFPGIAWDFANNSFVYFDSGTGGNTQSNGSTIVKGIYRFTPSTTAGVPSTSTLLFNLTAAGFGTTTGCNGIAVKQDGTVYALLDITNQTAPQIIQLNPASTTAYTRVDGTAGTYTGFQTLTGLSWDFTNQRILVFDQAQSQAAAKIISLDPATGTRTLVSSGTAASGAYGGSYINAPTTGFRNTANRVLYTDFDTNITKVMLSTVPPGSTVASQYYTAGTFGGNGYFMTFVPPSLPVITSPTASTGTGTTATLGATVTSSGTAIVAPTVQTRGVVYSLTSTNSNPTIGGTGVTQVAASAATGSFTVSASGLTAGATYSYAGYVSTYYGRVYTTVGTFVTPTLPTVTSPTATAVTGTSATLGGNVTADGNATITARGVVVSTTANNPNPIIGQTGVTTFTTTGTTGVFTLSATGLANGTQYTYRAYATNSVGTSYTAATTFTTISQPTANSQTVSVSFNTAKPVTLTGSDPNTPAQTLTYQVTSNPTRGTLSGTAPNLTYTPNGGANGADSFQFTTTNSSGLVSTAATVAINIAPGTPTANSQSVSVAFNTATAITLTGSDPDSPALTLTYTVVTNPTRGTLSGTAPNLTYTPNANNQGADRFSFRVSNGINTSNLATVSITVAAGTPTANAQTATTTFNTAKAITLTGTDPDSPALSLTYTVATAPTHGTLSGTAPNLTYTPTANYQGTDSFTFTASNGQKTSAAATVSITVSAGTPTANAQTVSANANTAKAITLTGSDPDSPALNLTYTVVSSPAHGTLSGTTPNLTYTPANNFAGTDTFTFTVSNGTNTSSAATVTINVAGIAPTITSATAIVFTDGRSNSFTVTTTGAPNAALSENGALPANVTFTDNGNGTATLSGTPAAGAAGSYPLTIAANNGVNPNATQTFTLTLNRPPTVGSASLGATQNTPAQASVAKLLAFASDADGDPLTVASVGANSTQGGTVSLSAPGSSGTITYTPAAGFVGNDSFAYVVSDGRGGTAGGTVAVTVSSANAQTLNVVSITKTAAAVTVVYAGIPGGTYQPQYSSNVNGPWTNDGPALTAGTNGRFTEVDATQPQPSQRFYRAVASP